MTKLTKFDKFMVLLVMFNEIVQDFSDMLGHVKAGEYGTTLLFAIGLGYFSWLLGMLYKYMRVPTYQEKGTKQ